MLGSGLGVAMATDDGCSRCAECLSKQMLLLLVSENNVHSKVPRVLNSILIPCQGHRKLRDIRKIAARRRWNCFLLLLCLG